MKTLVKAIHTGTQANGFGGCHTRWSNNGRCHGERVAKWLNSLGDDSDIYCDITDPPTTVGQLRQNWLSYESNQHIGTSLTKPGTILQVHHAPDLEESYDTPRGSSLAEEY